MESIYHEQKRVDMAISTECFALSQPQKSIWYLEQKYPDTCMNVIAGTLRLKGQIDYAALERAINLTIRNNDGLRIHVSEKDGDASQYLSPYTEKKLDFIDFSRGNGVDDLYRWDAEQTKIPFDLYDSDLCYFAIFKLDDENGGVYSKMHHMIADAWSISVTANAVMGYYSAMKNDLPIEDVSKPSFFEHLASEKKYEESERFLRDREYWNAKFEVFPEPTILKPQALSSTTTNSGRKTFIIPQKLSDKIREYCAGNNVSVFTLFLSALSIYIHRVTGTEDIILGTTTLNRINSREKDTIGMFVSVAAPIRIQMTDTQNFLQFSNEMLKETVSILKHQKYPYNYLIRDLKKKHKLPGRLFDIVLNYQNTKLVTKKSQEEFATRWHFSGHQVESLVIHINDRDDNGKYIFDYDFLAEVYNAKEIEYLHQHVISLLWHALDNPDRAISRLEMLSEKEKHQILYEFNNTAAEFPRDKTLHEFLYAQAKKTPDNVAVIYGDQQMTYREVNERSNQLARILREKGVKSDTVVGISVFRSFEMTIGLMAILKAGGAYLPMDPDYPLDRIQYMMKDSSSEILLTQRELSGRFALDADVLNIDDEAIYTGDPSDLSLISGPDSLAYIIYTSGSTGNPKGVMIEHRSIVNRINWMQKKYPITGESTILQKTPFTFDVSLWELFWWTFVGAKVSMLEPGGEKDPGIIIKAIARDLVTTMHFVPSMLGAFLDYVIRNSCSDKLSSLVQVFASGEALTTNQVDLFNRSLFAENKTQLYNLYGPTEASVDVSFFDCSPKVSLKTVPIGKPIDNIRLYILDRNKTLLPIGIPGELYIGGVGVARGYINNPVLTAEKFVSDPYNPGEILYKTGDSARWFPHGDIEYLGRLDFQVKIRGFRIELGEIESKLLSYSPVKSAVVVGRTHNSSTYLCAYYAAEKEVKSSDLKKHLSRDLPEYMIPTFFICLLNLPLSSNGKVDRKALPAPAFSDITEAAHTAPVTDTEKALAEIWSVMLELEHVGITEDFFDIGGDSLRAIALSCEIQRKFDVELSIRDIFANRTIAKMSAKIDDAANKAYSPIPLIEKSDYYPASSAQKRLYILRQIEGEGINYNLPGILRIEGKLDRELLDRSIRTIIERHESLRTSFGLINGEPVQIVHEQVDFEIAYKESCEEDIDGIINSFIRPFDLRNAPILRIMLIKLNDYKHVLLFDMHHIISDGESINILLREFSELYAGKKLPKLTTQYKDYSVWQNQMSDSGKLRRQEQFWLNKFADELPVLNMPTDFSRPTRKSFRGDKTSIVLEEDTTAALNILASKTQSTIFMILFAAYNIILSRYSGQEDIVVGTPIAGRQHSDVSNIIGMFVNTLAIRNFPRKDMPFSVFLQNVKANLLESYENQDYPIELLVEKICTTRDLGRNPIFDTAFVFQNMDVHGISAENLVFSPDELNIRTSKFDISLEACEQDKTIRINAEYSTDLFTKSTIDRLLSHFSNIIREITANGLIKISEINMLSEKERHQLIFEFNDTRAEYPKQMTLNRIFEEQTGRNPDNIALVFEGHEMTYRELNGKSNILAGILRDKGIRPDDIVAISAAPSFEMIIGILAILKAGAAYLPIDPDFPDDRISYMIEDSKALVMLTQKEHENRFSPYLECLCLDDTGNSITDAPNLSQIHHSNNLAYIIYTSGSTGKPKGVMIEHGNVVRLLFNSKFQFQFSQQDVWTLFHSFCFDFSVWEMYGALLYGGKLIIVKKQDVKDTRAFLSIIENEKVTVLNQTPAAFNNLIIEEKSSNQRSLELRYVIFGGDALKPGMLKPFRERYPATRLINMYGITETTVHVTFKEIQEKEIEQNISNIGKAIPTLKTYVVDRSMNLLPIGVPGELCVSGAGVGRGYLNNPELTALKFCEDPFSGSGRLYHSGDLARVTADGDLEYLGRIDNQIKIRGYRVELGEIESELLKHPFIREVLAIAKKTSGESQLFAYFVGDKELAYDELKTFLKKNLPQYMIPSFFIQIDKMPLNRNGKIDRAALPGSDEAIKPASIYMPPQTSTEIMLADLWSDVLGLEKIGIDDDFFSVGGESLSAIKVISRIPSGYKDMTLVDLYNHPTIRQLAQRIDHERIDDTASILFRLSPKSQKGKTPMICFPYGGGNVISYRNLSESAVKHLPEYDLLAVNLPGHDMDGDETYLSVEEVSELVLAEIKKMNPKELVLYGHCVGSAALIETARLIENEGVPIRAIFVGGIIPPKYAGVYGGVFDPWRFYPDDKIINYLSSIGLPYASFDSVNMGFIIKAFRHDTRSFYQYLHRRASNKHLRLRTPIHCIVGSKDKVTRNYEKSHRGWLTYSSNVNLHVIPEAEHYFINSHSEELAEIIKEQISEGSGPG